MSEEDYGNMPIEDFTHGIYESLNQIRLAMWMLVGFEFIKLWMNA